MLRNWSLFWTYIKKIAFLGSPRFTKYALVVFLFLLPFGTKKLLLTPSLYLIDYTALFLYATDIVLLLVLFLYGIKDVIRAVKTEFPLLLFLLFVLLSYFVSFRPEVSIIFIVRIILFSLLAVIIKKLYETKELSLSLIFIPLFFSACVQASIGVFQFFQQGSIGLQIFGEPFVNNILLPEIAKAFIGGGRVLRVFGTMPHANVFAAHCVLGIISGCALFFETKTKGMFRWILFFGMILLWLGILFSFSRSGFIAAIFVSLLFLIYGFFKKEMRVHAFSFLIGTVCFFFIILLSYSSILTSRKTFSRDEPSVDHRIVYNEIGGKIMLSNPLGVGIGSHALYALDQNLYEKNNLLLSWLAQPVHNIFIIAFAELGVLGGCAFLFFISSFFWSFFRRGFRFLKLYVYECTIFFCIVFFVFWFGVLDHFFWDIHQGMLMFWVSIGIMMAIRPHSLMERA